MNQPSDQAAPDCGGLQALLDRRQFLFGTGAAIVSLSLPGLGVSQVQAQVAEYPRKRIGKLTALKKNKPVSFRYPWDHANAENYLLRLGEPAGGGIGPDRDVVAFNSLCTHQGASMAGTFDGNVGIAGPCPLHWTTFDLTRYGTVISGHATLGLPQILLQSKDDDIFAVGVRGLIFGYHDNHHPPE